LIFVASAIAGFSATGLFVCERELHAVLTGDARRDGPGVEIDTIEAETLNRVAMLLDNQVQQIELLGRLLLFDKQLLVKRNEACAFCHWV
jgi:cytochrome c peroxidase